MGTRNKNEIKNRICLTRVAHNSLKTDQPVAIRFQIELEFGSVGLSSQMRFEHTIFRTLL